MPTPATAVNAASGKRACSGTYYCLQCGWCITLGPDQVMPVCESCMQPVISRFYHFL